VRLAGGPSVGKHEDILYTSSSGQDGIGYQGTMTAPGHSLGTHDYSAIELPLSHKPVQVISKVLRLHVIGIAAEAFVLPACVDGVFLCDTPSPQTLAPRCLYTLSLQISE